LVILEGFHALKHAIRFGAAIELAVTADYQMMLALASELAPDVLNRLKSLVMPVDAELFQVLSGKIPIHTKILAIAKRPSVPSAGSLESMAHTGLVVLLEDPRNLGNVGAVVRAAAAADAQAVVTTGAADPWGRRALRGSAGLHYALPVWRTDELPSRTSFLIALDPEGQDITELQLPNRGIFVFGTERGGLSEELSDRASVRVSIPMRQGVSSLNLATSVAVVLFMLRFQPNGADAASRASGDRTLNQWIKSPLLCR
jgi:RNA methyltransferase, TrmH family